MQKAKDEILSFNKDLNLNIKGLPFWITPRHKRESGTQWAGSIAVALANEQEAERAIRYRLYIGSICARVEKMNTVSRTLQCRRCQGFGHLENKCRRPLTCQICSQEHNTKEHHCPECQETQGCAHLPRKCSNCKQAHTANDRTCEVFQALLKSRQSL